MMNNSNYSHGLHTGDSLLSTIALIDLRVVCIDLKRFQRLDITDLKLGAVLIELCCNNYMYDILFTLRCLDLLSLL